MVKYNVGGVGKRHTISPTCSNLERDSSFLYARGGEATAVVKNHLLSSTRKQKPEMAFPAIFFSVVLFCLSPLLKIIVSNFPLSFVGEHINRLMTECD